jgi:hypothetical protein
MAAGALGALPVAIKHLLWRIDRRRACLTNPALAGEAWSEMKGGDH